MIFWRRLSLLLLYLLPVTARPAGYFFSYTPTCANAYRYYASLRLAEGNEAVKESFISDPHNLMATYLADYGDFLQLMFHNGSAGWEQRASHLEERIDLLDRAGDEQPWKRLCKGCVYLHWAALRAMRGENVKAALLFRKSYSLMKENEKRFPGFAPNHIFLGAEEAIAGTIPDDYSWLTGIFGVKGNLRHGAARLEAYLKANGTREPLHDEAVIYDDYIRFYLLSQTTEVWRSVSNEAEFPAAGNLLRLFVRANLALNSRHADAALQAMQDAQKLPAYATFPAFDYELGQALLLRQDGTCINYLHSFLSHNTDGLFVKDGWQKLAFALYLQDDNNGARAARAAILMHGSLHTDADRQAQRFAAEGAWPDALLLRARMLTDGGYFVPSLTLLTSVSEQHFQTMADRAEYNFRLGRALDESGNQPGALIAYNRTIITGGSRHEQFGARAALQAGLIHERRGERGEALRYFQQCLSMRNHDFQSSIDQQAKAGVARVSGE